LSRASN